MKTISWIFPLEGKFSFSFYLMMNLSLGMGMSPGQELSPALGMCSLYSPSLKLGLGHVVLLLQLLLLQLLLVVVRIVECMLLYDPGGGRGGRGHLVVGGLLLRPLQLLVRLCDLGVLVRVRGLMGDHHVPVE